MIYLHYCISSQTPQTNQQNQVPTKQTQTIGVQTNSKLIDFLNFFASWRSCGMCVRMNPVGPMADTSSISWLTWVNGSIGLYNQLAKKTINSDFVGRSKSIPSLRTTDVEHSSQWNRNSSSMEDTLAKWTTTTSKWATTTRTWTIEIGTARTWSHHAYANSIA